MPAATHNQSVKVQAIAPFKFPAAARFGKAVPKTTIYNYTKANQRLKQRFIEQVESLTWTYKLAPETINVPAGVFVREIQVFELRLKQGVACVDETLLRALDKAIAHPLLFHIVAGEQHNYTLCWKRPHDINKEQWVVEDYFSVPVNAAATETTPLPQALNLQALYEVLLRRFMPATLHEGEVIPDQLQRLQNIARLRKQISALRAALNLEKQFNRRVTLNQQIRELEQKLHPLTSTEGKIA